MRVVIAGAGRVGASLAREMIAEGHSVTCIDEDLEAYSRLEAWLGDGWDEGESAFVLGHTLERDALESAGIEAADVFVAATNGDNTNLVVAQIAERYYRVPSVICRVLDPLRAEWYASRGMRTVCPTAFSITAFRNEVKRAGEQVASAREEGIDPITERPIPDSVGESPTTIPEERYEQFAEDNQRHHRVVEKSIERMRESAEGERDG